jgi:hypothetical protein
MKRERISWKEIELVSCSSLVSIITMATVTNVHIINVTAALKCRQRKKQWLNNLQAKVEFLTSDNERLQIQSESLKEEIINLKTLLLAHKECPVAQANGFHAGAIQKSMPNTLLQQQQMSRIPPSSANVVPPTISSYRSSNSSIQPANNGPLPPPQPTRYNHHQGSNNSIVNSGGSSSVLRF